MNRWRRPTEGPPPLPRNPLISTPFPWGDLVEILAGRRNGANVRQSERRLYGQTFPVLRRQTSCVGRAEWCFVPRHDGGRFEPLSGQAFIGFWILGPPSEALDRCPKECERMLKTKTKLPQRSEAENP